jgi:hypothetical protein
MDFAIHLKSLLIANDRLCIPGLGTFITRYKPAEIVPGMNFIKPPSKEVSFDPSLKMDETGILASYIAKQEKVSIQDAYEKIKIFVDNITERINNDRNFGIMNIGTFSLKDGKLFFQPEITGNLRAESYGLPDVTTSGEAIVKKPEPVQSKPQPAPAAEIKKPEPPKIEEKKPAAEVKKPEPPKFEATPVARPIPVTVKAEPYKKPDPIVVKNTVKVQSGNGKWIFIGIAIPVIAVLICIFLIFPNSTYFSGLFSSKKVAVTAEKDTTIQTNASDVENYIDTVASQNSALTFDDKTVPETKTVADDKYAHCKNFYIVAGSFRNMRMATRFKNKLRNMGYEAEILIKGDTNRVYIKKFDNRQEALKDLEQLQASGMNVWLLSQ